MKRNRSEKDSVHHALAIARWEENYDTWLEGNYLGLYSANPRLPQIVGEGGTLWMIVSRRAARGGRLYSLSFRLNNCRIETRSVPTKFGRFGVLGDPAQSTVFASNDAKLLLLGLRFDPFAPIKNQNVIGMSIQTPRLLNEHDVRLLEEFSVATDRWSVFISYQHADAGTAERLSKSLANSGVHVFRDKEALRGGEQWWPALERAIKRSRYLVVLLGKKTHESVWVKNELKVAMEHGVRIIPVFAGADLEKWKHDEELMKWHALNLRPGGWSSFLGEMLRAIGSPVAATDE